MSFSRCQSLFFSPWPRSLIFQQLQTFFSKGFSPLKQNVIWKLWVGATKVRLKGYVHMTKIAIMPIYGSRAKWWVIKDHTALWLLLLLFQGDSLEIGCGYGVRWNSTVRTKTCKTIPILLKALEWPVWGLAEQRVSSFMCLCMIIVWEAWICEHWELRKYTMNWFVFAYTRQSFP